MLRVFYLRCVVLYWGYIEVKWKYDCIRIIVIKRNIDCTKYHLLQTTHIYVSIIILYTDWYCILHLSVSSEIKIITFYSLLNAWSVHIFIWRMSYCAIFKCLVLWFYAAAYFCHVSAKCDNKWLEQYESVLKTINNRPGFPAPLTKEFKVKHLYH